MVTGQSPRVSVVIPAHNDAPYIGTAIDSILQQDFQALEVIVVDDASSDNTGDIVTAYSDTRVRYMRNQHNLGIAGARNRGLDAAQGEFMASLDSDDWAHPSRLARQIAFLEANPDHAAVGSWARWMDSRGQTIKGITQRPITWQQAHAQLIYKSCVQQPSVTTRTEVMRALRYDENYRFSSDYELWVRMARHYRLTSQPEALVYCRRHATSTTRSPEAEQGVVACQKGIFAQQFDHLQLDYKPEDLDRHRVLWRAEKTADLDGRDMLAWSQDWLMALQDANIRHHCYPQQAFEAVLGWGWCQVGLGLLRHASYWTLRHWLRGAPMRFVSPALKNRMTLQMAAYRSTAPFKS